MASRFFHRFLALLDVMHLLECKGVTSIALGSTLDALMRRGALGNNQTVRLQRINREREQWYKAHPGLHRLPKLFKSNIVKADGWAELHGPAIKAANTRVSVPFFLRLAREFLVDDSEHDRLCVRMLESLSTMYEVMYASGIFMTADQHARFKSAVRSFGVDFQGFRADAMRRESHTYQVTSKVHKVQHLPLHAGVVNPIHVQCYADERQMGTTAAVWRGSLNGRYQRSIQRVVLTKRLVGVMQGHDV